MARIIFGLVCSVLTCLSGLYSPAMEWGAAGRLVNICWSTVYGAGWLAGILAFGYADKSAGIVGSIVWPLVVIAAIFHLTAAAWRHRIERKWKVFLAVFLLSFFVVVPLETALQSPLRWLPLSVKFLD